MGRRGKRAEGGSGEIGFPVLADGNLPDWIKKRYEDKEIFMMFQSVELAKRDYYGEHGYDMPPSKVHLELQNALYRALWGAAPVDLDAMEFQGGPHKGKPIKRAKIGLADPQRNLPMQIQLDADIETIMGGSSSTTDLPLIESPWDSGLHGATNGMISPPMMGRMLRKQSRSNVFLPMCYQDIAPELIFKFPIQTNTVYDELFEGDNLRDLKAAVLPRREGRSGIDIRPRFTEAQFTTHGHMFHTPISIEAMSTRGYRILGLGEKVGEMLAAAPSAVDEYSTINGLWYGMETGYVRRPKVTAGVVSWDVSTNEVPWRKANFITSNNYKHMMWWDHVNGKFYEPHVGTNYRKYADGVATQLPIGVSSAASGNKVLEVLAMLQLMMDRKGQKMNAVFLHSDMVMALMMDERMRNALYWTSKRNLRFAGEEGYVGDIPIAGEGDVISLFKYSNGSTPQFQTADTDPQNITYLAIGCAMGEVMTNMPFLPTTIAVDDEFEVITKDDSQLVTRRNGRRVTTIFDLKAIEPLNLEACVIAKCMNGSPPGS